MIDVMEARPSDDETTPARVSSTEELVEQPRASLDTRDWDTAAFVDFPRWPSFVKGMIATIMSSPPAMFMAWGPELHFFFNDAYRVLLGDRAADAMGRPFAEVWSEIWPDIEPIVAKALSGTGSRFDSLPLTITRNGFVEETSWSFSYMPLRNETSEICGMYCVVEETTAEFRAQAVLQQSNQHRAFLLELSSLLPEARDPQVLRRVACEHLAQHLAADAVAHGSIVDDPALANVPQYVRYGGAGADAPALPALSLDASLVARLRGCHVITVDDTQAGASYLGQPALPESETRAFILVPVAERGALTACAAVISCQPRLWSKSEITLVSEFAARVEAALIRLRSEDALRQAQKMEAVGHLASGIAHDFNNLLNLISGSLELARHDRPDDPGGYLAEARNACDRAAGLTDRLLAFARRQVICLVPVSPGSLVDGMKVLVSRAIGPRIKLRTFVDADAWQTLSDPNQLENALLNLCINARDAMLAGGTLTVETRNAVLGQADADARNMSPGEYLSLSITNTGSGMSPATMAHAFEPFYTTKPEGAGTGLGLAMVHGFAKQCGGHVRIHSRPRLGTTVTIYLPRLAPVTIQAIPPEPLSPHSKPVARTFLIVDDEPGIRMLVTKTLTTAGYTAIAASDGFEALDLLNTNMRIDLLITDVSMSGMDGQELALAARRQRPNLQVLFITGYSERVFLPQATASAGLHVLTKPFTTQALASKVASIIPS